MKHLALITLCLVGHLLPAQVQFVVAPDTPATQLAMPLTLQLTATGLSETPQWPAFPDSTAFELLHADTAYPNATTAILRWEIAAYDSGYCVFPPLTLLHGSDTLTADPVVIYVQFPEVDPNAELADIHAPETVLPLWPLLIVLGLKLMAIITALIMMLRHRRSTPLHNTRSVPPSPLEQARQTLLALRHSSAWERQPVKTYCTTLSDTLRRYAETAYQAPVMERTTAETRTLLLDAGMEPHAVETLVQLLQWADMAKFAKGEPAPAERLHQLDQALAWLETAIPQVPQP